MKAAGAAERMLPFSWLWPIIAGALVGLLLRVAYPLISSHALEVMGGAFIFLTPMAVGAITVDVAERQRRRSWAYYIGAPIVANALFVLGTVATLIEGAICGVIALPLFGVLGAIAGVAVGALRRVTSWPRHAVFGFAALPLAAGFVLPESEGVDRFGCVERALVIDAPAQAIWREMGNTTQIRSSEVERAWIYRIGVPLPISGVIERTPAGLVRKVTMGKDVHFDQVVTHWQENEYVRFTYRFEDDSFPSRALDDHVRIGGRYFDLIDTSYTLSERAPGSTLAKVQICYRVTTDFNGYADLVARVLIGNVEEVLLDFYRARAMARSG